jgi:hypothetical protein
MNPRMISSPYRGLTPYTEEDSAFFFGRERECSVIIDNLIASRLTLIYGATGVGKSSMLRAGVCRRLAEQPEFKVLFFNAWRDEPAREFVHLVRESAGLGPEAPHSIPELLRAAAEQLNASLLIILDQLDQVMAGRVSIGDISFRQPATHSVADLRRVLDKLSSPSLRIVRAVVSAEDPSDPRYEVYHDVLSQAVLDWRSRYLRNAELERARRDAEEVQQRLRLEEQARRAGMLRRLSIGLSVLSAIALSAVYLACQGQRSATQSARDANRAAERGRFAVSRELARTAISEDGTNSQRILLLALASLRETAGTDRKITLESRDALLKALNVTNLRLKVSLV